MSDSKQNKSTYHLVDMISPFQGGRWTDSTEPVAGYENRTSMRIEPGKLTSDVSNEDLEIFVDLDEFSLGLSEEGVRERVKVLVTEISLDSDLQAKSAISLFNGVVSSVTRNPEGFANRARFRCVGEKNFLKGRAGAVVDRTCDWELFGPNCLLTRQNYQTQGNIIAYDRTSLQIFVEGAPTTFEEQFARGSIEVDGLRREIRYWNRESPETFFLFSPVPENWVGQQATLTEGCVKSRVRCNEFGNTLRFGGIGVNMRTSDPNLDVL